MAVTTAWQPTRRDFLGWVGLSLGAGLVVGGCGRHAPARRWRVLTEAEAECVATLAEQIIPTDEDPGAREAGCVNFIDRQLAGFYASHWPTYRRGLAGVDETSRALYGRDFAACAWEEQTAVLRRLEAGTAPGDAWAEVDSRAFFRLVRDHTMQGFYGSPRHGGNRNNVSYRMLGLDYPQIVGQNRYRDEG